MGINDFINIGTKIKTARLAAGYKQKDFAELLEIPIPTLANYEGGKREPNKETIEKVLALLDISLDELIGFNERYGVPKIGSAKYDFSTEDDQLILDMLNKLESLNSKGKSEVLKRINELIRLDEYTNKEGE